MRFSLDFIVDFEQVNTGWGNCQFFQISSLVLIIAFFLKIRQVFSSNFLIFDELSTKPIQYLGRKKSIH